MRRHLTTGIKAILTVAALSTAVHWAMRFQREADDAPVAIAAVPDPVTTGSIGQRAIEAPAESLFAPASVSGDALDQEHLTRLFGDAASAKPAKASGRR